MTDELFTEMTIEAELCDELKACLTFDERVGWMCIKHPLCVEVAYMPQLNNHYNNVLQRKKQTIVEARAAKDWFRFLFLHERPFRIDAFLDVAEETTDTEYWELLGRLWMDSENLWQIDEYDIRDLLGSERPKREYMMTIEDRNHLASMSNMITIYRGHQKINERGWSWTTDKDKAKWFGRRFAQHGGTTGRVACGTVNTSDVVAYMSTRDESEIIVDPELVSITTNYPV